MILGTYGIIHTAYKNIFLEEGYTEDEAEKLAKASAKKMTPHPTEQFIDIARNFPSSVGISTVA